MFALQKCIFQYIQANKVLKSLMSFSIACSINKENRPN